MFRRAKRRTTGRRNFEQSKAGVIYQSSEFSTLYKTRLSFYDVPPIEEITIEEFETWAIDRLKVLIEIESCVARSKSLKDIEAVVKPLLLKYLPLSPDSGSNQGHVMNERRKDHYSHYILRLVFCRSDELRKKFVKNETILFKVRYNMMQPKEQQEFIETNKDRLPWSYISNEEKTELLDDLFHASGSSIRAVLAAESGDPKMNISSDSLMQHIKSKENFIKLPFVKVPNLVASRQTLIRKGQAYIPSILQLNLLSIEFQDALNRDLLRTFQAIPRLEDDDRILPLLNNLSYNFSNIQYESSYANDSSLASDINAQSVTTPEITKHFPLCALHLQKNLVLNSHLRYQGRQQLGLFLKGIGLNVDEALKFWSYQFTKSSSSMSIEKYNKEYKYNVRHTYGLEGARIHYKPWDCARILSKPKPGKGEYHGCPYRDMSVDALVSNLNDLGFTDQVDLNNVIDDVGRNDYTVACTRVFEITHKKQLDRNKASAEALHISHPNLYFDRSRQLARLDSKATS
ncbi:Piso0_000383 [Millerozyma farinosa CBS 7064]|uniref:DNA primase large subunit n=1 Tax=Pichia sorbitophila (strain ATCC MYA-4447 / BCRC 22081 / CBS 7064 / NBRC 10061 / NRRL Y-12695) TaxID=559304 RepID=G8YVA6_PICSO|nr:Piso0_000383 [Millerozyma farinosa CBS 7064]CCE73350.1 Piso0_000383 [Millerozyma farinosa CBS 7064]